MSVAVAERTSRENLADSIESYLADPANPPRPGIGWPALRTNIETTLLGESYEDVLRSEHRVLRQKLHEDTTAYSQRYLASAKSAYPEPWGAVTNQDLIALFAEGLVDKRMARDVGVVMRKPILRETKSQTRSYAGIESSMRLRDDRAGDVSTVQEGEVQPKKKEQPKEKVESATADHAVDPQYAALAKQIASISSRIGEMQAGTRKPPPQDGSECYNCGKPGHFSRELRCRQRGLWM